MPNPYCVRCHGTGTYLMAADSHKSEGMVPCGCSLGDKEVPSLMGVVIKEPVNTKPVGTNTLKLSKKQYNHFVVLVDNLNISQDAEIILSSVSGNVSVLVFDKHEVLRKDL